MEVDKLLIIAHPDDEVLWGGMNLLLQPGWFVICSTHLNDPIRSREFFTTMSYCNVTRYIMFDVKDEYTENPKVADKLYDGSLFEKFIKSGVNSHTTVMPKFNGIYQHFRAPPRACV